MSNLKKAQNIMLDTLIEVDRICKKYNIDYWLDSDIFPLVKIKVEEKEFFTPNNCDTYLRVLYGNDYMILPPKESQHIHATQIEVYNAY